MPARLDRESLELALESLAEFAKQKLPFELLLDLGLRAPGLDAGCTGEHRRVVAVDLP